MTMKYKGYTGSVEYDPDDRIFHGKVQNITADFVTFEGTSVDELEADFKEAVDDYLEFCAKQGFVPQRPYSGRFVLRLPPTTHGQVTAAARRGKCSMNSWIVEAIQARLEREKPAPIHHAEDSLSDAAGG